MNFTLNQQGLIDRQMSANLDPAAARLSSRRGSWVRYELLLQANSADGVSDGELHVWIDGVKTHQYLDVDWQMSVSRTWQSLAWNPTYGGGPHPVPHDQRQYIDHIRLSGGP